MKNHRFPAWMSYSCALFAASLAVYGQTGLGSISGSVLDPSRANVPNANVKVVQLSTNSERTVTTTQAGIFTVPSLVPSDYTVTINAPGFKEKVLSNLKLNSFQDLALGEIVLEVGSGPAAVVEVFADAVALATESAVRDNTIQSKQVTEIPLQGHTYLSLVKLIPGANAANVQAITGREAGPNGLGDFVINGKAANTVQLNLDGGTNVDHGTDTKATVAASMEAIQEISVLANNYQAQYGTREGAVINVTTKSGSNQWHGTGWDYLRNEAFNANSASNNLQGISRPYYRYNYFGVNLGGRILKDKLFFFVNQETLRASQANNSTLSRVPTDRERIGDFSQTILPNGQRPVIYSPGTQASGNAVPIANNMIPPSLISPLGEALLNIYPLPNFANNLSFNYLNVGPTFTHRWQQVAKIDWNINSTTRAYFRGTYDYEHSFSTGAFSFTPLNASWRRPDRSFAANVTKTLTPTVIVENLFSWQMDFVHHGLFNYNLNEIDRNKLGLAGLPLAFQNVPLQYLPGNTGLFLPQLINTGFTDISYARFPWFAKAPEYQGSSTVSWIHGTHVTKAGIQIIVNKKNEWDASTAKGAYDFGVNTSSQFDTGYSPANMLTGAINSFQQVDNPAVKYSIYQDTDWFIQDTWKITSKLTLDYGVRFYHMPGERNTRPDITKPAMFDASKWDPTKAPRFYIPAPGNPTRLIDPANPNVLLPANVFSALLYSIVPGSGDLLNGVVALGDQSPLGNPRYILWAPRGGFAWQFTPKTVLRGGFGWGYGRPSITQAVNTFEDGLANQVDYRMTNFATLLNSAVKRLSPLNFGAYDPSTRKPQTIYDFSLTVQRELPMKVLLDVGYVGNLQRHQLIPFNLNTVLPGTAYLPQFIDSRLAGNNFAGPVTASNPGALPGSRTVDANLMRPYPGLGALNAVAQVGNNRYSSLQVSATKRYSKGLSAQAVYTWGKLIRGTEAPVSTTVATFMASPYYKWKDYTGFQADGDRGQTASFNYTYEVPKLTPLLGWSKNGVATRILDGWSLAHVVTVMSGRVTTPTFTLQYANSTQAVANFNSIMTGSPDIAPRLQPTSNPNGIQDLYHTYNINAFNLPDPGGIGTGSRSYLLTPGTFSNDLTVTKMIPIAEKYTLELRVSAFNLFNTPRFQDVNLNAIYKMNGANFSNGYRLLNSPEAQVSALLASTPNASAAAQFNTFRTGVGSANLNTPLDPRRLEMVARFRF